MISGNGSHSSGWPPLIGWPPTFLVFQYEGRDGILVEYIYISL